MVPPTADPARWRRRLACAIIVIAAFGAYVGSLPAPFIFDDLPSITYNPTIRHLSALGTVLSPPAHGEGVTGRPVVNLSLALDYAVWHERPWGFRLTNIAIHACAALVLFGLLRRTLERPVCGERLQAAALPVAFSVSLLWTLHPLQTETVVCVIQRTESLVSLFLLLTLYCYLRAATSDDGGPRRGRWAAGAVAACFLGMASKEVMVGAPLLALLYDRTFLAGSLRGAWRARRNLLLGLAAGWLLLGSLVVSSGADRGSSAGFGHGVDPFAYLLTQARAITVYLKLTVWPHPLVVDYGSAVAGSFGEVAPQFLFVAALGVVALVALRSWPLAGFAAAGCFIVLAPSSSVVPLITQTIAEHRMYLPLAGVLALFVVGLHRFAGRRTLPVCLVLAAGATGLTVARTLDYRDDLTLWLDAVAHVPDSARAHTNLATSYYTRGKLVAAREQCEVALRLDPTSTLAQYNLGVALLELHQESDAVSRFQQVLRTLPDFTPALIRLGIALINLGRPAEALPHLEAALRYDPQSAEAHARLGLALAHLGRVPDACTHYRASLALDPADAEVRSNYGVALFQLGQADRAVAQFNEALRIKPDLTDGHFNLGLVLEAQQQSAAAIAHYETALRLDPSHFAARLNLGIALARAGRMSDALPQFEEAVRLRPNAAEARENLGLALAGLGRYDDARQALEEGLRLQPDLASAHYNLGNTLLRLGQIEAARGHFAEAVRREPRFDAAREMLARLPPAP